MLDLERDVDPMILNDFIYPVQPCQVICGEYMRYASDQQQLARYTSTNSNPSLTGSRQRNSNTFMQYTSLISSPS